MASPKAIDKSWERIFEDHNIRSHDFKESPCFLSSRQIKTSCQNFEETSEKEVRILCKQDHRDSRPAIFIEMDLFLLPVKNGEYAIIEGEGYVDIPEINDLAIPYDFKLDFPLETLKSAKSEMQHLDYAFASSLIRSFVNDNTLILTIRGRKFTKEFSFSAGKHEQALEVSGVQTEVDAGYEGKNSVVLVEAKNSSSDNVIIRQLYYPFHLWKEYTSKPITLLFFEKRKDEYCIWNFEFTDKSNYNSIKLVKSARYTLVEI